MFHLPPHDSTVKPNLVKAIPGIHMSEPDQRDRISDIIQELARGLAEETDSREHRFQTKWAAILVERYTQHPGNPIVHLHDFVENSMIYLRPEARSTVKPYWERLSASTGYRWAWNRFSSVARYLHGRTYPIARLKKWKDFGNMTGFDVDTLEPHVDSIRISDGRHVRTLTNAKLPVNLATPSGGRLVGYFGDLNCSNGSFTNKDPALHEDFCRTIREVFGDLTTTETIIEGGGFGSGHYIRTNVGFLVTAVLSVGGYDCSRDQKTADNPLPSWIFTCDTKTKSEYLSSLWDTEGSVNSQDLKVRQAVPVDLHPDDKIPAWPGTKDFKELTLDNQFLMMEKPPLLIISAALLLFSLGIVSRLVPTGATFSGGRTTAYWQLRIHSHESIQTLHGLIRLRSLEKQTLLNSLVG